MGREVRWTFHRRQLEVFQSTARFTCVVAGRRGGKSEVAMMRQIGRARQHALAGRAGVSWIVAPTYRLTRTLWRKAIRLAPAGWITGKSGTERMPDYLEFGPVRMEFKGADRPESLVSEGVLDLLVDESGIVKEQAWTESLLPTLIDHNADALLIGTPKGRNWFFHQYVRGLDPDSATNRSFGWTSYENPFVSSEAIDVLAGEMPQRMYRQEILAQFLEEDGAVFRGHRKIVAPYSTGRTVVLGVDLAKVQDFTVIYGMDAQGRCTHFDRFRELSWPLQKKRIASIAKRLGAVVWMDSTGVGDPIFDDLKAMGVRVKGYKFTNESKAQLVEGLSLAIEEQKIRLPDEPVLLNELDTFEYETTRAGNIRYNAPEGLHDDAVVALALANHGVKRVGRTGVGSVHF